MGHMRLLATLLASLVVASTGLEAQLVQYVRSHGNLHIHDKGDSSTVLKTRSTSNGYDSGLDGPIKELGKQVRKVLEKVQATNPLEIVARDFETFRRKFMPGKPPRPDKRWLEAGLVVLALSWLGIWWRYIYENDEDQTLHHWPSAEALSDQSTGLIPDLVLVFYNPNFDYADHNEEISCTALDTVVVEAHRLHRTFDRIAKLSEQLNADPFGHIRRSASAIMSGAASIVSSSMDRPETQKSVTLGAARLALLQDVYENLFAAGFDVDLFKSIDDDEIFMCINLNDEDVIRHRLRRGGMHLQMKKEVLPLIGIIQPPDETESSPPFIRFDTTLPVNLLGKGHTEHDIFQVYGANREGMSASLLPATERYSAISMYLSHHLDCNAAVNKKLLKHCFPAHDDGRLAKLQASWASWHLLKDLSCRQPLSLVQNYFGTRVAFIFAWNGLYAKALLSLLPVAIFFKILSFVWQPHSVAAFSIIITTWARIASNMYQRSEKLFIRLWHVQFQGVKDTEVRPDFRGELVTSPVDQSEKVLFYCPWKYMIRQALSWLITLLFCGFNFMCRRLWLGYFQGNLNLVASVAQAIMIFTFSQIYDQLAEVTTIWENHKFSKDFYSSFLTKMSIFQFVNQYCAFFYIAVQQANTKYGCPNDDCIEVMRESLQMTLASLAVMRLAQTMVGTMMVKINDYMEDYAIQRAGGQPQVRSFLEEQAKYGDFSIREQIEAMTSLSVTLGYILIFGGAAPLTVPIAFAVFFVQIRAAGILLTTACTRTIPRVSHGIGTWQVIVEVLMHIGVIFSGYLTVKYGVLFKGTAVLTRLMGVIVYCFFIRAIWFLVDLVYPASSQPAELLERRRQHSIQRIFQASEDALFARTSAAEMTAARKQPKSDTMQKGSQLADPYKGGKRNCPHQQEVQAGTFDAIPKLSVSQSPRSSPR